MFDIRVDDLSGEATRRLLTQHLQGMQATSPPGHVFALDLAGLKASNVTVWSVWDGHSLVGIGALKDLGGGTGELYARPPAMGLQRCRLLRELAQ